MKTKVAAIYGKRDVRLRVFELPEITDNELLVSVISDSVCLSTRKAALLGSEHKRVPDDLENHPVITGHECAGLLSKWVKISLANIKRPAFCIATGDGVTKRIFSGLQLRIYWRQCHLYDYSRNRH